MAAGIEWIKTETSLALHKDGKPVWIHHHDPAMGKPRARLFFGLHELTRPYPEPLGYKKQWKREYDQPWHYGLWWSWKYLQKPVAPISGNGTTSAPNRWPCA